MSQQNGLRVGVIGCGYWGSKHVRALSSLESVAKVSVIEPNAERADAMTRTFPAVDSYPTLDAALPHIDAVVIATPPSTHGSRGETSNSMPSTKRPATRAVSRRTARDLVLAV